MIVEFYVPVEGVPKGSKTAHFIEALGRSVIVDSNNKPLRSYESSISAYALEHFDSPVEGPIVVEVAFVRAKKKSAPKTYRPFVTSKPDTDKMLRAVLDGLQGFAYVDDGQVCRTVTSKLYPDGDTYPHPGTYITIRAGRDVPDYLGEFSPKATIDF